MYGNIGFVFIETWKGSLKCVSFAFFMVIFEEQMKEYIKFIYWQETGYLTNGWMLLCSGCIYIYIFSGIL